MTLVMMVVGVLLTGWQQGPPRLDKLPPANRVTDTARPDYGYMQPWAGTVVTVAVVYSAQCEACDGSVPFYKRLAAAPGMDGKAGQLTVLADGGIAPVSMKIQSHGQGFNPHVVSYPKDDRFKVSQFPTLIIFDGAWKKRGEWQGRMSPAEEAAALDLIDTVTRERGRKR